MKYYDNPPPMPCTSVEWRWFTRAFKAAWLAAWREGHDTQDEEVSAREATAVLLLASEKFKPPRGRYALPTNASPFPPPPAIDALREAYAESLRAHKRTGPDLDAMLRMVRAHFIRNPWK